MATTREEYLKSLDPGLQAEIARRVKAMTDEDRARFASELDKKLMSAEPKKPAWTTLSGEPVPSERAGIPQPTPEERMVPDPAERERLWKTGAALAGFAHPMQRLLQQTPTQTAEQARSMYPTRFGVGEFAGYTAPFMVPEMLVPKLATLPAIAHGAISMGAVEAAMKPEKGQSRAENAVYGALTGAGLGVASKLVGKLGTKALEKYGPRVAKYIRRVGLRKAVRNYYAGKMPKEVASEFKTVVDDVVPKRVSEIPPEELPPKPDIAGKNIRERDVLTELEKEAGMPIEVKKGAKPHIKMQVGGAGDRAVFKGLGVDTEPRMIIGEGKDGIASALHELGHIKLKHRGGFNKEGEPIWELSQEADAWQWAFDNAEQYGISQNRLQGLLKKEAPEVLKKYPELGKPLAGKKPGAGKIPKKAVEELRGWHTVTKKGSEDISLAQRGPGTYIALDKPFKPETGQLHEAVVKGIKPAEILDPDGLLEGTNPEKSIADWQAAIDEVNALPAKSRNAEPHKDLQAALKRRGYKAQVGEIEPGHPEHGRELVVWDRKYVSIKPVKPGAGKIPEPEQMSVKKPWNMTQSDFENNPPKGFKSEKLDGEIIAMANTDGTISLDPSDFFSLSVEQRKGIIVHERMHFVEAKIPPEVKAKLFDNKRVMAYRGRNINEKLANMLEDGKLPKELRKYIQKPTPAKPPAAEGAAAPKADLETLRQKWGAASEEVSRLETKIRDLPMRPPSQFGRGEQAQNEGLNAILGKTKGELRDAKRIEQAAYKAYIAEQRSTRPATKVDLKALQDEYRQLAESEASHTLTKAGKKRMAQLSDEITTRINAGEKGTTISFMGANPDLMRAAGEDAVKAAKAISRTTSDMIDSMKTPPHVKVGLMKAIKSMIQHDRMVRDVAFVHRQLEKVVNDVVPDKDRQMLIVHAYEHKMRGKYWDQLNEIEKGVTRWAAQEKNKLNKFIRDNNILEQMSEKEFNHIFHSWINPKTGLAYEPMYGKFSKGLPQAKQRLVPTYEAGIEKGMTPATTNIGKMIGLEWEAAMRAHQSRMLFTTLHSIEVGGDQTIVLRKGKKAKPIRFVESWSKLKKQGLTEDYEYYTHPALDKPITFKTTNGRTVTIKGAVGIQKDLYPYVKAYIESPSYGKLDKLLFVSKSLKFAVSFFHGMTLGVQELANGRIPFKNIPSGLRFIKELGPELRLLHREGYDIFGGYEDIGGYKPAFEGGKVARTANRILNAMRSWLFGYVQPGMKGAFGRDTFNDLLPKYLKKYNPEVSLAAARAEIESGKIKTDAVLRAARDTVKAADGFFSQEHYKRSLLETNQWMVRMLFMPEARKFWQRAMLSFTWQREHALVGKRVAESFMTDKMIERLGLEEMGPIKGVYRKYALGAVMMVGAVDLFNQVTTKKMDGKAKHLWQNPSGKGFAMRAPWNMPGYTVVDKNGKERKIEGGPAYIRPLKSVFELAEFSTDTFKKLGYKLSPIVTAIAHQFWPGKYQPNYGGITDPKRTRDFILDMTQPFTVDQGMSALKGKRGWKGAVLPAFGFPVSKVKESKFLDYLLEQDGYKGATEYIKRAPKSEQARLLLKLNQKYRKKTQNAVSQKR